MRGRVRGKMTEGFVAHVPADVDVKAILTKLGLGQDKDGPSVIGVGDTASSGQQTAPPYPA